MSKQLETTRLPELVFGLVGPVGTDLREVSRILGDKLGELKYRTVSIRISGLIGEIYSCETDNDEHRRIENLMELGDRLRRETDQPDAAALLAVSVIRHVRREFQSNSSRFGDIGTAYVLHSLKRPEEVQLLREIYGPAFFLISVYSERSKRVDALAKRIAYSKGESDPSKMRALAEGLVSRDEKDPSGNPYGQNTRDAFPEGDLFVNLERRRDAEAAIWRFLRAIFGYQFHTPDRDEYGMFHARAVALRSSDLSRQVGAVISLASGEIIAAGCNEVPKAGGGQYWEQDNDAFRDFEIGYDSCQRIKTEIINEIKQRLTETGALIHNSFDVESVLDDTRIANLLEFGRIVHGEMAALMDAARRGVPVHGATMYVTTQPCHMCARHIIASGIERVVYIEPYPKSLAKELYEDSVSFDACQSGARRVLFENFIGNAPSRYFELFSMGNAKRKDNHGNRASWKKEIRFRQFTRSHEFLEIRAKKYISETLASLNGCRSDVSWLRNREPSIESLPKWAKLIVQPSSRH